MGFNVVGIGEVLWDLLPTGPQLGGAPANFAFHAHGLGANASVVTRVGSDKLGRSILQRLTQLGIPDKTVQVDASAPTGTVTVSLSREGVPNFTIHEQVAWDRLEALPAALEAVRNADAVCFGTLAQRTEKARQAVQALLAATPAKALRVFDINLRQKYFSREVVEQSLRLSNVLKLNDGELPIVAELLTLPGSPREQIESLADKFDLQLIALTRGPAGSLLYEADQWSDCPSTPTQIVDTVGAGDAFTAALVMGRLHGIGLEEINSFADEVARYVCGRAGATPPLPEKFRQRLQIP